MSSLSLQKIKMHKSIKKQRMVELEKGFVSNCKIQNQVTEYDALDDKHASHYFLNKPVKKHLKKLAKVLIIISSNQVINLEPLTTQNQKIIHSLNGILETYNIKNLSDRKLKETFIDSVKENSKKSNLSPNQITVKNRLSTFHLYDPYTQSMKPSSIEKIRKCKLQTLKKRRYIMINKSSDSLNQEGKNNEIKQSNLTIHQKNAPERKNETVSLKISKHLQKVQVQNHSKHLKFVNFINKKKNELECPQHSHHQQVSCITEI